jgi:hypothetical protein
MINQVINWMLKVEDVTCPVDDMKSDEDKVGQG